MRTIPLAPAARAHRGLAAIALAALLAGLALAAPAADPQYDAAMDLLDDREYQRAFEAFQRYIDGGGPRTDAALYWQAHAMYKLGRTDRSIDRLNRLLGGHPKSEWRDEAEALMVELRGDAADPDQVDRAELKILALQSVMRHDPQRAIASIKRMIDGSPDMSIVEQAMFVLAQADDEAARKLLFDYARDGSRPEVARAALQQVAIHLGSESSGLLLELYDRTTDPKMREAILSGFMINGDAGALSRIARSETDLALREQAISLLGAMGAVRELEALYAPDAPARVREAVLNAYMIAGETGKLLEAAKTDPDASMREKAVSLLGAAGAAAELEQLYRTEKNQTVRRALVTAFMVAGDSARLLVIAREDTDPEIRLEAIQMLGVLGASAELDKLRRENPPREVMKGIVGALMIQGDAKSLIEIYRTSKDPEIRSMAVQHLSVMDSEEALEFMLELLEEEDK